jgi:hypothetical protein
MFSAKFNFTNKIDKLLNKIQLQTMNYVYSGKPFIDIVSQTQETKNLDTVYQGKPFVGAK